MDNLLINAFLVDYLYEEDTLDNHTQEPQQQRQELPKNVVVEKVWRIMLTKLGSGKFCPRQ